MIKKLFTLLIFFFLTVETFAAGTSSSDKKPSFKNAVKIIEAAKKYELSLIHISEPTRPY